MSEPAVEHPPPPAPAQEAPEVIERANQDASTQQDAQDQHQHQDQHQDQDQHQGQDQDQGPGQDQASNQTRIEKDVGTILAGLNQEQLASIVAAARASEAGNQGQSESGDYPTASEAPLADLAGQAASALTSFASSFKRSASHPESVASASASASASAAPPSVPEHEKLDDAPPPPGTEYQAAELQHHVETQDSNESHESATAAALASLGSLSSQQQQQQQPDPSSLDHSLNDAIHENTDSTPSGKRGRGPELDRQRKDNHKEVERRRRSAISDGIMQLSQIVPGCDAKNTNKSSIIVAAVRYIQDLKNNEASNIEKWTLEKLLMDQAMNDLTTQLDETRRENESLRAQLGKTEPIATKRTHEDETHDEELKRPKLD